MPVGDKVARTAGEPWTAVVHPRPTNPTVAVSKHMSEFIVAGGCLTAVLLFCCLQMARLVRDSAKQSYGSVARADTYEGDIADEKDEEDEMYRST